MESGEMKLRFTGDNLPAKEVGNFRQPSYAAQGLPSAVEVEY
jgi:hypothetical protein